jgi:hypothetical protein
VGRWLVDWCATAGAVSFIMVDGWDGGDVPPAAWTYPSTRTSMGMSIRERAIVSLLTLAITSLGAGCQKQYPNCKAFDFDAPGGEPRLLDDDASPEDCGNFSVERSVVDDSTALDCALDDIAAGKPMKLSVRVDPEHEISETWTVFSDEDGLAMRWRIISMDLNGEVEAKVYELDTGRVADCRDHEDAGERFSCLDAAFDAAEVVKTCMSKDTQST